MRLTDDQQLCLSAIVRCSPEIQQGPSTEARAKSFAKLKEEQGWSYHQYVKVLDELIERRVVYTGPQRVELCLKPITQPTKDARTEDNRRSGLRRAFLIVKLFHLYGEMSVTELTQRISDDYGKFCRRTIRRDVSAMLDLDLLTECADSSKKYRLNPMGWQLPEIRNADEIRSNKGTRPLV